MEFDDFMEPEIAVTAAVAAAVFSPRARKVMRKGLVYGMAGMLATGDALTSFARSVGQGVRQAGETATAAQETTQQPEQEENEAQAVNEAGTAKEASPAPATRRKTAPKAGTRKTAPKAETEKVGGRAGRRSA